MLEPLTAPLVSPVLVLVGGTMRPPQAVSSRVTIRGGHEPGPNPEVVAGSETESVGRAGRLSGSRRGRGGITPQLQGSLTTRHPGPAASLRPYGVKVRMALRVTVPTTPSATRVWARWKAITAALVRLPKMPSMLPTR
jgi:hypothetical protein